jgi:hypothetical protein
MTPNSSSSCVVYGNEVMGRQNRVFIDRVTENRISKKQSRYLMGPKGLRIGDGPTKFKVTKSRIV